MNMRKLQKIVYAGLLGGALLLNGVASAAVVTNRLPLLGYADHNIAVYRAPGGVQAAIVPAVTALIQITQVRADGWAYGSYPLNGRRVGGWFRMSDIQNNVNYSNVAGTIVSQQPVYRTPNRSGSNGIVTAGDNVLVIAEQSGLSQIIYKQKNSVNWRIGWVMTSAVKKTQNNVVTGSTVANKTIQTAQTTNTTVTKTAQVAPSNNSQTTAQKTSTGSTAKTANPQTNNITLSNTSNAGLQLGKVSNQVINRYGKALQQVPAFTASNLLNRSGIINAGSTFVVLEASDNAYKITYSANNILLERWVNKNYVSLLNVDYKIWQGKMMRRANAFYNIELTQQSNQKEYAESGDNVTILNEKGDAYFVSYPLNNGSYKARWVEKSAVSGTNPNRVIAPNPVINNNTNPTVKPVQRQNVTNGVKGDMNQDGKVNQADLEIMSQIQVGKIQATDVHKIVGDMNGDGTIDIIDLSQLMTLVNTHNVRVETAKRHCGSIYNNPNLTSPQPQRWLSVGEQFTVLEDKGNVLHIKYKYGKYNDKEDTGWVSSDVLKEMQFIWPVNNNYKLTTLFYYNGIERGMGHKHSVWWHRSSGGHFNALDIACPNGTQVKAVARGTVVTTPETEKVNHIIVIDHGGEKSLYAHLRKKYFNVGDKVESGWVIGEASDVGVGGGAYHLHLEFLNSSPWDYYKDKVPLQYCTSTLSAYNKWCTTEDKKRFGEAVNWIQKNTKGFIY